MDGYVSLTGIIAPKSSNDKYPVTEDIFNKGGFRVVSTHTDMLAIFQQRRKPGMFVYVVSESKLYKLTSDNQWEEYKFNSINGRRTFEGIDDNEFNLTGADAIKQGLQYLYSQIEKGSLIEEFIDDNIAYPHFASLFNIKFSHVSVINIDAPTSMIRMEAVNYETAVRLTRVFVSIDSEDFVDSGWISPIQDSDIANPVENFVPYFNSDLKLTPSHLKVETDGSLSLDKTLKLTKFTTEDLDIVHNLNADKLDGFDTYHTGIKTSFIPVVYKTESTGLRGMMMGSMIDFIEGYPDDDSFNSRILSSGNKLYAAFNNVATNYEIWTKKHMGSGSGLDADMLDGHHWSDISKINEDLSDTIIPYYDLADKKFKDSPLRTTSDHNVVLNTNGDDLEFSSFKPTGANGRNIFIGGGGKNSTSPSSGTGSNNISLGYDALLLNTSGYWNIAIGNDALKSNTVDNSNIAIGVNALKSYNSNHGSTSNIAIGLNVLQNSQGVLNTAIGGISFNNLVDGSNNVAVGSFVLANISSGDKNVAIGSGSGNNTALITNTSSSVLIGYKTALNGNNEVNEIVIGAEAIGKGSNTAVLGNGDITDIWANQNGTAIVHASGFVGDITTNITPTYIPYADSNGKLVDSPLTTDGTDVSTAHNFTVLGDLTVRGTTTTVDSENVTIKDNEIELNQGETGAGITLGKAGLLVHRGTLQDTEFIFDETDDKWKVIIDETNHILAYDDLSNVQDNTILNKLKNVDGENSGLDADLLDGHEWAEVVSRTSIPINRLVLGNDTELTSNANLTFDGSILKVVGDANIGAVDKASDTDFNVLADDNHIASINAYGNNQGTGRVYIGQTILYGGGFAYNGDNTPSVPYTQDKISFFRRNNGTDYEVFYYAHDSNNIIAHGSITATLFTGSFGGQLDSIKNLSGYYGVLEKIDENEWRIDESIPNTSLRKAQLYNPVPEIETFRDAAVSDGQDVSMIGAYEAEYLNPELWGVAVFNSKYFDAAEGVIRLKEFPAYSITQTEIDNWNDLVSGGNPNMTSWAIEDSAGATLAIEDSDVLSVVSANANASTELDVTTKTLKINVFSNDINVLSGKYLRFYGNQGDEIDIIGDSTNNCIYFYSGGTKIAKLTTDGNLLLKGTVSENQTL